VNAGKTHFAQAEFLPWTSFSRIVHRLGGHCPRHLPLDAGAKARNNASNFLPELPMSAPARPPSTAYVSTGHLPGPDEVRALVAEAHATFRHDAEGALSKVYPALERVDPGLFGICVVGVGGNVYTAGDVDHAFTIQSVSKPFVFALVCQAIGVAAVKEKIGVNATGRAFNSVAAVEASGHGLTNPMVNPGAIATSSLVPGETVEARWRFIAEGLAAFAGRPLAVNEEVLASARATNFRNQGIARVLQGFGKIYSDPAEAVDLYTKQCCLELTAKDLATMGATLADGGVNPLTKQRVVSPEVCHYTLAVMATAGLYETSGDWLFDIGLPGKSGIGGGIVTVSPGKGGLGTFAPLLDAAGNSVKGQRVAKFLSESLGMDLFVSRPEV
jgi:glutaminase